jgi:hypothetical protein
VLRYVHVVEDAPILKRVAPAAKQLTKAALARYVCAHARTNLFDESGVCPANVAIYGLSDPRDIRDVRYIGQTGAPQSRFLQHLTAARLWLPDALPWWVKSPRLRPLYGWIRELYSNDRRLPVMVISAWTLSTKEARSAERARIVECLGEGRDLFNIEKEFFGPELFLL